MCQMTFHISGKGSTKSYAVGAYLPPQYILMISILPETYHQAYTTHTPLST